MENAFNKNESTNAEVFFIWSPKSISLVTSQGLSEHFSVGAGQVTMVYWSHLFMI